MALPPLELFSQEEKAALLPGGLFDFCGYGDSEWRRRRVYCARRQRYNHRGKADVAQLVEQPIRNRQVSGSSPLVGSIRRHPPRPATCSPYLGRTVSIVTKLSSADEFSG